MKPKSRIMDPATRLKKIRLYLGMTRQQFGDMLEISQYTIRSWENGAKKFTADGIQRVIVALKRKVKFSCTFDWMMHGVGFSPISLCEEKKIQSHAIVSAESSNQAILDEIVSFKKNNRSASVILVDNNGFYPIANAGDYVGLTPVNTANLESYIDKLVIVTLAGDQTKFGVLKKTQRSFDIVNFTDSSHIRLSKGDLDKLFHLVWLRKVY
ncbi:MAG TPA: helix-turn-helix domain-containing protein [Gammaproteobacteria bacterium]|nr:helix-turn-helix domain-containing protein [Gammaproteobacteria bacterium]